MGFADFIKDSFGEALKNVFRGPSISDKIVERVRYEIFRLEKRIMTDIVAMFFMLLSFAVFALAALFALIEYLHLTKTLSFLIIAAILLLIGIILKLRR